MKVDFSPETYKNLLMSVGNRGGKRPLSPVEVGALMRDAINRGVSVKDLAIALHLNGSTMVGRFVRLLSLPSDVQLCTDWGRSPSTISFTSAFEISGLEHTREQSEVCLATLEHGLSAAELRSVVQLRRRSATSASLAVAEVLRGRTKVVRRHLIVGSIPESPLRGRLAALTQFERDALIKHALWDRYSLTVDDDFSARLGEDRFTLSCSENVSKKVLNDPEGFETGILRAIEGADSLRWAADR